MEAGRTIEHLLDATAANRALIDDILDKAAGEFASAVTGDRQLLDYRRLVLRGEPGAITRVPSDGSVELLVPLEMAVAWRRAAGGSAKALDRWVTEHVELPRGRVLTWEAAAAASGAALPEWIYACWLRRICRSSV